MDEREMNDAIDFLKKHTAPPPMGEHEAVLKMVRAVAFAVTIIILGICASATSCSVLEYRYAFENGYERAPIPGSTGTAWKKADESGKTLQPETRR